MEFITFWDTDPLLNLTTYQQNFLSICIYVYPKNYRDTYMLHIIFLSRPSATLEMYLIIILFIYIHKISHQTVLITNF